MESPDLENLYEALLAPAKDPKQIVHEYAVKANSALASALLSIQQIRTALYSINDTEQLQTKFQEYDADIKDVQTGLENYILKYFK